MFELQKRGSAGWFSLPAPLFADRVEAEEELRRWVAEQRWPSVFYRVQPVQESPA